MDRNVNIITDLNGNKIVLINDIIFKGKRAVNWDDVKVYLEAYVGEFYEIVEYYGHKKRNEQPFRTIRFYLAKNPSLFYSIRYVGMAVKRV